MNIFLKAEAGIFAASRSESQSPTIAELICAGLCEKIASDRDKLLDSAWWAQCVSMIPGQVAGQESSSQTIITDETAPSVLAEFCVSPKQNGNAVAVIEALLKKLPTLNSLICLIVSLSADTKTVTITLVIIAVEIGANLSFNANMSKTISTLNYGDPSVASNLNDIFGSNKPLEGESYYVSFDANN